LVCCNFGGLQLAMNLILTYCFTSTTMSSHFWMGRFER
jgi:hypothetical protein